MVIILFLKINLFHLPLQNALSFKKIEKAQVSWMYWFSSKPMLQKFGFFDLPFIEKLNKHNLKIQKCGEVARKGLRLKQSRKTNILGILDVRIKTEMKNSQQSQKRVASSFLVPFSLGNGKILTRKAFLEVTSVSLTLDSALSLKSFEKTQVIQLYLFTAPQETNASRW